MADNARVETLAIEPFGSLEGVLRGDPIRIFPVGKFYRDNRVLDVTPARLKQFAANIKAGLPRFEPPINLEHKGELGRYGSVLDLEYLEAGVDGPGLYATRYELTPDGRRLIEAQRFKGLSGEAVWTLYDGAKYQDPNTGDKFDNVLVGLALTNTALFGRATNLYSAFADNFKDYDAAARQTMAKAGTAMDDGSYPIANTSDLENAIHAVGRGKGSHAEIKAHIVKRAKALGASKMLPAEWMDDDADADDGDGGSDAGGDGASADLTPETFRHNGYTKLKAWVNQMSSKVNELMAMMPKDDQEDEPAGAAEDAEGQQDGQPKTDAARAVIAQGDNMADEQKTPTPAPEQPKPETLTATVSVEEFTALKLKAERAEQLASAQAVEMLALKRARRHDQIAADCERFSAAVATPDLADKFQALEEASPELYAYFHGLLTTVDAQLSQAQLFSQVSSPRPGKHAETIEDATEAVLKSQFGGDASKYSEAFAVAGAQRPDLAHEYLNRGR